ncbi:MAG: hypothetical protein ACI97A_001989, partial [Planctomycetota bacterium]
MRSVVASGFGPWEIHLVRYGYERIRSERSLPGTVLLLIDRSIRSEVLSSSCRALLHSFYVCADIVPFTHSFSVEMIMGYEPEAEATAKYKNVV